MVIPGSVSTIGSSAFYNCDKITELVLNDGLTSIGSTAFYNCNKIETVTIPKTVTMVGTRAFSGCIKLTSINWNAINCTSAGTSTTYTVFENCPEITSFTFGDEVSKIPGYVLYGMTKLTELTISESVTSIGVQAFGGCSQLAKVNWNAINCDVAGATN